MTRRRRRNYHVCAISERRTTHTIKLTPTIKSEQCNKKKVTNSRQLGGEMRSLWEQDGISLECTESPIAGSRTSCQRVISPQLSWSCSAEVWVNMLSKDQKYKHSKNLTERHPTIQPEMRAVLLDWLMEVCEAYTLHRQTFYLAQDFVDRFLLAQENMDQHRLQLTGITALFIASKVEEINPPKVSEFAYVSDGACAELEILQMELIMLKVLNWDLCPETALSWVQLYLQMASQSDVTNLLEFQFAQETYTMITQVKLAEDSFCSFVLFKLIFFLPQLLDLCILDVNSLDFTYGVLAAAALYHFTSIDVVQQVSGLKWMSLEPCVNWMVPFVESVAGNPRAPLMRFLKVPSEERHNIQTHTDYLTLLQEVQQKQLAAPPYSTEKAT
ncbi:G1/S-specific cyclin-E2-like isoform X3 [Denticeps clupeoides]|uniref:G1/S-specific cyclin-E2-like isoform X3 n=1 Tax=Denticeps clupeoides TaxID=299321 RepID=UPI0010A35377|nr:G1/S-specific cyclin-E2-like isoform X3 [Denticeps clupeoides]